MLNLFHSLQGALKEENETTTTRNGSKAELENPKRFMGHRSAVSVAVYEDVVVVNVVIRVVVVVGVVVNLVLVRCFSFLSFFLSFFL